MLCSIHNKDFADEVGVIWQQVDHWTGVQWNDIGVANAALQQQCDCSTGQLRVNS